MRVLVTVPSTPTHFQPLVPLIMALQTAGHEVAVASPSNLRSAVESLGCVAFTAGIDHRGRHPEELRNAPDGAQRIYWNHSYLWRGAMLERMVADLLPIMQRWHPDVVVRDDFEIGGLLVAEHLGIPHAVAGAVWFKGADFEEQVSGRAPTLQQQLGLAAEPITAMAYRYLALPAMPREWPSPDEVVPVTAHFLKPVAFTLDDYDPRPSWLDELPDQPTVHVTLGTVFNRTPGLYDGIISALRDEPLNLIVTVGQNQDPASFGSQPTNVRIERFVPHRWLLPMCDVLVTHGGYGTIMAAFDHALPLVVLPIMGDQLRNAARCAALGAGIELPTQDRTPEAIRAAVHAILAGPGYRSASRHMQDRLFALPSPDFGVSLLEQVANEKRPILAEEPLVADG